MLRSAFTGKAVVSDPWNMHVQVDQQGSVILLALANKW